MKSKSTQVIGKCFSKGVYILFIVSKVHSRKTFAGENEDVLLCAVFGGRISLKSM